MEIRGQENYLPKEENFSKDCVFALVCFMERDPNAYCILIQRGFASDAPEFRVIKVIRILLLKCIV